MAPKSVTFRRHDHLVSVLFGDLLSYSYNITFSMFLYLVHIVLVYRSPHVPISDIISFMSEVMDHMNVSDTPCFILGDFNEDLLVKTKSQLLTLMAHYGFSQIVTKSTTNSGTLIDHVYTNKPSHFFQLFISDTYYSDHDEIYCSFPA